MNDCRSAKELGEIGPLTISSAEAWRVAIPMLESFRISSGEVACKEAIIVCLQGDGGFGWGESSSMPGSFYSSDTPDTCERELIGRVLPALAGRSFPTVLALETALAELTPSCFVRVAIETAAWEMLARQRGQSLRQLFGIQDRPIPSGLAVGLYDTTEKLHVALERYCVRDYRRLKIKIKRGHDLELVRSVRQWYGDMPLFVDANADYSLTDIGIFQEMDRYSLMMFEQPFARDDFAGSAELQRAVHTPVCFDESAETVTDIDRAAESNACRIVNIKLQRVGGFLQAIRIVERCISHGIALWMGTMPELGIGSAQALALAAHPSFTYPTDVEPSERWFCDDILQPQLVLNTGTLILPQGPGLGFTVDNAKLEHFALRHWSFPA